MARMASWTVLLVVGVAAATMQGTMAEIPDASGGGTETMRNVYDAPADESVLLASSPRAYFQTIADRQAWLLRSSFTCAHWSVLAMRFDPGRENSQISVTPTHLDGPGGRLNSARCDQLRGTGIHTWWDRPGTDFAAWIVAFYRGAQLQPQQVVPKQAADWLVQMAEVCLSENVQPNRADLLTACIKERHSSGMLNDAFLIVTGDLRATIGANTDEKAGLGRLDIVLESVLSTYIALAK